MKDTLRRRIMVMSSLIEPFLDQLVIRVKEDALFRFTFYSRLLERYLKRT
jgi:hypothetical protein